MLPLNLFYNIEKHLNSGSSNISPLDRIPDLLLPVNSCTKVCLYVLFVLMSVVSSLIETKAPFWPRIIESFSQQ